MANTNCIRAVLLAAAIAGGTGCATTALGPSGTTGAGATAWTGTVQSIQEVQTGGGGGWAAPIGGVLGTVVGAVLGSGIGAGVGKTIASVVTSGIGSIAGQRAGVAIAGTSSAWDVAVRGSDGVDKTVRTAQRPNFSPGATVTVGADGSLSAAR